MNKIAVIYFTEKLDTPKVIGFVICLGLYIRLDCIIKIIRQDENC